MKSVSISGSPRANVGKKDAKSLRKSGLIPCVLYGGKEQIHFSASEKEFKDLIYTPDVHTVELNVGNQKYNAILQEAQYHTITDELIHVDFLQLIVGKEVTMDIPVKTHGVSPGVRAGGKLLKKLKTLKAKGLIDKMPDDIQIDISVLQIGDSVKAGEIKIDGITLLNAPNVSVVSVQTTRAAVSEASAAAGAPAKK